MTLKHKILTEVHTKVEDRLWIEMSEINRRIGEAMEFEVNRQVMWQININMLLDLKSAIINDMRKKHGFFY